MNLNQLHTFPSECLSSGEVVIIFFLGILVCLVVLYFVTILGYYLDNKNNKDKLNKK